MVKKQSAPTTSKTAEPEQRAVQLSLELEDNQPHHLEMEPGDIGAALASTLSEGLYTNPMHAIREYVQNAIDAEARKVTVKLTANSVIIADNGNGMDLNDLIEARKFGISPKDFVQNVGFRGIGIYSGFDLCNKLTIISQKRGQKKNYTLVFDFAAMKQCILKEQLDRTIRKSSLIDLISKNSYFSQESGDPNDHSTIVILDDVKPFHLDKLYKTEELKKYILKTLPIDFDDSYEYKKIINDKLQQLPGYRAAHVVIQADGQPDILVAKPGIPNLQPPEMGFLKGLKGEKIAFYWACMNRDRGKIADEFEDFRGFTYKVKGFTVGDNHHLQSHFSPRGSRGLYLWWVGEIYVIDPYVIPNAERDDFQSSPARDVLDVEVDGILDSFEDEAARFQREGRASDEFDRINIEVAEIEKSIREREPGDKLGQWRKLEDAKKLIKKQRSNLPSSKKDDADRLTKKIERLATGLVSEIGERAATPEKGHRKQAQKRKDEPEETGGATPKETSRAKPPSSRTLTQIIDESGWDLTGDNRRLVALIESAMCDVLGTSSAAYENLLASIEELLADTIE